MRPAQVEIEAEEECAICVQKMRASTTTFVCRHEFCQTCIVDWNFSCVRAHRMVTCPLCRAPDPRTTVEITQILA